MLTLISRASRQTPFITTNNVLQFTLRRRTVDSAKEKLKGKFLKSMIDLFMRGQMTAHINSFTGNVFSFDYGIKEKVNVAAVQPSRYGCTSAVW